MPELVTPAAWNEQKIIETIKEIVRDTFDIDLKDAPPSLKIGESGLDSMAILDVVMSLEDLLGHKIKTIDLPKNPSLQDVAALVMRNLPSAA
jgi:acyl carrier protein